MAVNFLNIYIQYYTITMLHNHCIVCCNIKYTRKEMQHYTRSLNDHLFSLNRHAEDKQGWLLLNMSCHVNSKADLDGLVCVCDEGNEQTEHHVNEEREEGVEVEPAEQPHHVSLLSHLLESGVQVITVDQREQALRHLVQGPELVENQLVTLCIKVCCAIKDYKLVLVIRNKPL